MVIDYPPPNSQISHIIYPSNEVDLKKTNLMVVCAPLYASFFLLTNIKYLPLDFPEINVYSAQ
jgi:hypothetical protein